MFASADPPALADLRRARARRYSNLSRLPRSVKLGRQTLALQQPSKSWDSVSSTGMPSAKGALADACSELWVIVEFCDRGTLGVRAHRRTGAWPNDEVAAGCTGARREGLGRGVRLCHDGCLPVCGEKARQLNCCASCLRCTCVAHQVCVPLLQAKRASARGAGTAGSCCGRLGPELPVSRRGRLLGAQGRSSAGCCARMRAPARARPTCRWCCRWPRRSRRECPSCTAATCCTATSAAVRARRRSAPRAPGPWPRARRRLVTWLRGEHMSAAVVRVWGWLPALPPGPPCRNASCMRTTCCYLLSCICSP